MTTSSNSARVRPTLLKVLQRDHNHATNPPSARSTSVRSSPSSTAANQAAARAVGSSGTCNEGTEVTVNGG